MVVAVPDVHGDVPSGVVAALRDARARGARIVSICSGAFALAAAGLLDGREATTHWRRADLLRRRHPKVKVTPITVAAMARAARLSHRTFVRHFARETGTSPLRWVVTQRVLAALPPLEDGTLPIEEVGAAVGFESPATFRHHFARAMRTSPSAYRRTFRADGARRAAPGRTD